MDWGGEGNGEKPIILLVSDLNCELIIIIVAGQALINCIINYSDYY